MITREPLRALLIEDNSGDVRLIEEFLKEGGAEIDLRTATTLLEGLNQLSDSEVDILLLDLGLPDSQGFETFERVYARGDNTPIIILTGLDDNELGLKTVQRGAQDYLIKGHFDSAMFLRSLRYSFERHKMKSALERSVKEIELRESNFRTLIEKNGDGMIIVGEKNAILFVNPAAEALFDREAQELIGDFFPHPLAEGGASELEIRRRDQDVVSVEMRAVKIVWEGKSSYLASLRNITERKRAVEALRKSEGRYRTVLDDIEEGYYEVDLAGNLTFFNDALARALGYPQGELLGMNYRRLMDDRNAQEVYRLFNRIYTTGEIAKAHGREVIRKDGAKRIHESSVSLIKDASGKPAGFRGVTRDITERKRDEEALLRSQEESRRLAQENAIMAEIGRIISSTLKIEEVYESFAVEARKILSFDRISVIMIHSEEKTATVSYFSGDSIPGRKVGEVFPLAGSFTEMGIQTEGGMIFNPSNEDEVAGLFPGLLPVFQSGFRSMMILPLISKNQTIAALHFMAHQPNLFTQEDLRLAKRVGGQIAGAIANAQLFKERQRIEEERLALEGQLRQSQKMEAVGRLAGGIAHDLNNVLTVTKVCAQLALMDLGQSPSAEKLREIDHSVDRATNLIHQLLAFSRRQVMEMRVLDLNEILREMGKMLPRVLGEDVELRVFPAADLWRVKADRGQIEQVIMNLAVNARDAMPSGGQLTLETGNVELDEKYCLEHVTVSPGPYVMLSVSDSGVGMAPEVRERIFEPFFTTKEAGKGTGLGLAVVYGIVKQSGGYLWVYSEPGEGTAFKIYLPRVEEGLEREAPKELRADLPRGGETILVVEDDANVRKIAVQILERQDYRVVAAAGGEEALGILRLYPDPIHLLMTDVIMPGMSGRELVREAVLIQPCLEVIYMSGYTENAIVHHGVLQEGIHFLAKPFSVESMSLKVRQVLDQRVGGDKAGGQSPAKMPPPGGERAREGAGGGRESVRARQSHTILLVEDDVMLRKRVAQILQEQGDEVLEAGLWEEALGVCEKHSGPLHLLISNLAMPGMGGRELARRVAEKFPSAKVLYMSFQPPALIERMGKLPPDANYISKPFSLENLRAKVQEVLVRET